MRPSIWALSLSFALAPVLALDAQGTIRGVVFDSLRTGRPVAGAEVVLFGTSRRDTTDARGRFAFAGVASGEQRVAYWAPWLDSLAVPPLEATVSLADARIAEVLLATPSVRTAQLALCGAALDDDATVILGEVRDRMRTPLAGAPVYGWWHETLLGKQQLEQRTMATADTTDAVGMYVLCGIPRGARLEMHADGADSAVGAITFNAVGGIARVDLTVGAPSATMLVTGRVLTTKGEPIASVLVSPPADSVAGVRTAADGRFALRLPARTAQLWFRAVGFGPVEIVVEPPVDAEGAAEVGDVSLQSVRELGTVSVVADGMTRQRLEFEERRKFNHQGTFFDDEELAKLPIVRPAVLAMKTPRSFLDRQGRFSLESNGGRCFPKIFVDGADHSPPSGADVPRHLRRLDQSELYFWLERAKRVEVYRDAFAPPRFADVEGCGAIVIWTK